MKYNFEWDPVKAKSNLKKHGISFEEAAEIFLDPLKINIPDEKHSETEERWITLGNTKSNKLRLVVHIPTAYEISDLLNYVRLSPVSVELFDVRLSIE